MNHHPKNKHMNYNRMDIKIISFTFFCFLLYMQNTIAQDSSSTGDAKIALSFAEQDSLREITATITQPDAEGKDTAVNGVDVHFYVKKSFGLLPLEGDMTTTDENGQATADLPGDMPGDASGNVTVIARTEDDEKVGNVEITKTLKWGIPVKTVESAQPRALWASANNAPWPLVIFVTGMVAAVWGVIFYIFYQLAVIKREGKYESKRWVGSN